MFLNLWNPSVYYPVQMSLLLVRMLSQVSYGIFKMFKINNFERDV
jgi:hypothetical protein